MWQQHRSPQADPSPGPWLISSLFYFHGPPDHNKRSEKLELWGEAQSTPNTGVTELSPSSTGELTPMIVLKVFQILQFLF